jgi:proton glutamate symport protein
MPPRSRYRLSLTFWTFVACLLGGLGGRLLARHPFEGALFIGYGTDWLARVFLTAGSWLALPLIFASIITGANGLEPMRGVGRVAGKTTLWILGSSGLAALIGVMVARVLKPAIGGVVWPGNVTRLPNPAGAELWISGVLVAVAMAVYRNQIEETRARLLLRFATAIDETLTLLLEWARRLIPAGVGVVALSTAAHASSPERHGGHIPGLVGALVVGWSVYGLLVLPVALIAFARIRPWRYAGVVGAPVLAALAGGSPAQVFPLTLDCLRTRAGVSHRVSGLVLAGCTALLRDGQALGWALAFAWVISPAPWAGSGGQIFLGAWLLGCTGAAGPAAPVLLCGLVPAIAADLDVLLGMGLLIELAGNAVSVFSQTCAAAVIARSEGECDFLPGPSTSELPLEIPTA